MRVMQQKQRRKRRMTAEMDGKKEEKNAGWRGRVWGGVGEYQAADQAKHTWVGCVCDLSCYLQVIGSVHMPVWEGSSRKRGAGGVAVLNP